MHSGDVYIDYPFEEVMFHYEEEKSADQTGDGLSAGFRGSYRRWRRRHG